MYFVECTIEQKEIFITVSHNTKVQFKRKKMQKINLCLFFLKKKWKVLSHQSFEGTWRLRNEEKI